MNRNDLVKILADKFLADPVKTDEFVDAVFTSLVSSLKKGKNVNLMDFGRFSPVIKTAGGGKSYGVIFTPVKKFADEVNYNYEGLPHVRIKSIDTDISDDAAADVHQDEYVILDFTEEYAETPTAEQVITEETKEEPLKREEPKIELPETTVFPEQTVFLDTEMKSAADTEAAEVITKSEDVSVTSETEIIPPETEIIPPESETKPTETDEVSEHLVKLLEEREKILEEIDRLEKDFFDEQEIGTDMPVTAGFTEDTTPVFEEPPVFTVPPVELKSDIFGETPYAEEDRQKEEKPPQQEDVPVIEELLPEKEASVPADVPAEDTSVFEELPHDDKTVFEELPSVEELTIKKEKPKEILSLKEIEDRIKGLEQLVFDDRKAGEETDYVSETTAPVEEPVIEELKPQEQEPETKTPVSGDEISAESPETMVSEEIIGEKKEAEEIPSRQILGEELKALHEDIEKEPADEPTIHYVEEPEVTSLEDAFEEKSAAFPEGRISKDMPHDMIKDYTDVFTPVEHLQRFGSYPPMVIGEKPVDKKTIIKGFLFIILIIVALLIMISIYTKIGQKTQPPVKDTVTASAETKVNVTDTSVQKQPVITEFYTGGKADTVYTENEAVFFETAEGIIIQAASFSTLDEAQAMVEQLRGKQVNARVIPVESGTELTEYRVITGPYSSLEEAKTSFAGY